MAPARLHLFYGSDSYASQQAVQAWTGKYVHKYDAATVTRVSAEDGTVGSICAQVAEAADGISLFSGTRLILLSRVAQHSQAASLAKALVGQLLQSGALADPLLTVVWREETGLADKHPIMAALAEPLAAGLVQLHEAAAPSGSRLASRISDLAASQGVAVTAEAQRWVGRQYQVLEQLQRSQQRLKKDQPLRDDYRSWWLAQLISQAALLSRGSIGIAELEAVAPAQSVPPSYFAIADAVLARNTPAALRLWEGICTQQPADAETVRGLAAILRWAIGRPGAVNPRRKGWMLRALGEAELIERNFDTDLGQYGELLICSLGEERPADLLGLRNLWLTHWARS